MAAPITGAASAFSACPPPQGVTSRVVEVDERLELTFDSGTRARLWGVEVPQLNGRAPASGRDKLHAWLSSGSVSVQLLATTPDRWGRIEAHVYGPRPGRSELSVAEALVDAGLARVRPETGDAACLEHLWGLEEEAVRQGLGLWAEPSLRPLDALDRSAFRKRAGEWLLVRGKVLSVNDTSFANYLNFGPIRTVDFSVTVRRTMGKELESVFGPLGQLAGRSIEVRGLLDLRFGPQIEIDHVKALRVFDGSVSRLPYSGRETRR